MLLTNNQNTFSVVSVVANGRGRIKLSQFIMEQPVVKEPTVDDLP